MTLIVSYPSPAGRGYVFSPHPTPPPPHLRFLCMSQEQLCSAPLFWNTWPITFTTSMVKVSASHHQRSGHQVNVNGQPLEKPEHELYLISLFYELSMRTMSLYELYPTWLMILKLSGIDNGNRMYKSCSSHICYTCVLRSGQCSDLSIIKSIKQSWKSFCFYTKTITNGEHM